MRKRNIYVALGAIIGLLVLISTGAYAIFTMDITLDELALEADISSPISFTSQGGDRLTMNIDAFSMNQDNTNNIVAITSDAVILTLDTDGLEGVCCSYDFLWAWDSTENTKNQYHLTSDAEKEYVLTASYSIDYMDKTSNTNVSIPSSSNKEMQIPNYSTEDSLLFSGELCNLNNGTLTDRVIQNYVIKTEFYNLEQNQNHIKGATFAGKLKVGNIACQKAV